MRRGLLAAVVAFVFWGLATFYWRLLAELSAPEILFHRILWALPVLLLTLALGRRLRSLWVVGKKDRLRLLGASLAVASNWGLFIWAVLLERVVEASLAYYINPFLSIAFGVVLFGERLTRTQWTAVALAATGVLTMVLLEGQVPWLALVIAFSFATYGAIRKGTHSVGPLVALTWEVMLLFPVALIGVLLIGGRGGGSFGEGVPVTLLLIGAGLVTVIPLFLFGTAVRSIPLAWVGILQFITPTMFFLEGAFLFGEEITQARWIGFGFVWAAVALFLMDVRLRGPGLAAEA